MDDERAHTPMSEGGDDDDFVFDVLDEGMTVDNSDEEPEIEPDATAEGEVEATGEEAAPAEPDAQPRDDKGRFVSKADAESAVSPDAQPAPTPAAAEAQPEGQPATTEQFPPFRYRAGGMDYTLEGSQLGTDGLFLPTDKLGALGQQLSLAQHARQSIADLQRKLGQAQRAQEQKVDQANKTLEALESLMVKGPEAVAQWLDDLERNWPLMKKDAELQALRAQQEADKERQTEAQQEQETERLVPVLADVLEHYINEFTTQPQYTGIDKARMYDRLSQQLFSQVFIQGKENEIAAQMPHAIVVSELANGEVVVVDPQVIEREFQWSAQLAGQAAAVAQENKGATAQTTAPPTVAAAGTPAAAPERKTPKFKSREEVDEWIESGKWRESTLE